MQETFTLEIVRPMNSKKIPIQWIEIKGINGSFLVGPHHSPLISILKEHSKASYKNAEGFEQEIEISGGIVAVDQNKVTLLLDL